MGTPSSLSKLWLRQFPHLSAYKMKMGPVSGNPPWGQGLVWQIKPWFQYTFEILQGESNKPLELYV